MDSSNPLIFVEKCLNRNINRNFIIKMAMCVVYAGHIFSVLQIINNLLHSHIFFHIKWEKSSAWF